MLTIDEVNKLQSNRRRLAVMTPPAAPQLDMLVAAAKEDNNAVHNDTDRAGD